MEWFAFVWVPYQIIRKINGVSATVFVQIASLPASPNVTNILMTYGNILQVHLIQLLFQISIIMMILKMDW